MSLVQEWAKVWADNGGGGALTVAQETPTAAAGSGQVGRLLRNWRRARHKSQLALALDAGVSARHLGFLETGRARPSRRMLLTLADALDVPLRERNLLLLAAGHAPVYRETRLDDPGMAQARTAVDMILGHQEPYPAVVMDRHWNILRTNRAADRLFGSLLPTPPDGTPNVVRLMFDPGGLRPFVSNWPAVADGLMHRIHRESLGGVPDETTTRLLAEVLAYPGVAERWREPDPGSEPPAPFLAVEFEKGDLSFSFFSTVTTLGTPLDITLQELRIECFFPGSPDTAARARELLGG